MNRRSFLSILSRSVAAVAVAPTILPAATTYVRQWRKQGAVIVPFWHQTSRTSFVVDDEYQCIMEQLSPATVLRSFTWSPPQADLEEFFRIHPPPQNALIIENFSESPAEHLKRLEGKWT